jgi:UDP-glucose 4-epimerase
VNAVVHPSAETLARRFAGMGVLVTGGAGFIGNHLSRALLLGGASVRVLDDLSTGSRGNVPAGVEFIKGSVVDPSCVRDASRGCQGLFHLAAMVSVPATVADPRECFLRNVVGTENVIRAAVDERLAILLHTSSAAVYGPSPRSPSSEDDPIRCVSPYASSKAAGEMFVQSAWGSHRLPAASLRLFNVFGPGQDPKSQYAAVISAFVDAGVRGLPMTIYGDGGQTRDFVPVGEVVRAFLGAGAAIERIAGQSLNVGLGKSTTIRGLAEMVRDAARSSAPIEFRDERAGDVRHSRAAVDRLSQAVGFSLQADVGAEIARLVDASR